MQHSTNTPNSSSFTSYPYQKDKGAKKKNGSFVNRAALHSKAFSFPFYFLNVNAGGGGEKTVGPTKK